MEVIRHPEAERDREQHDRHADDDEVPCRCNDALCTRYHVGEFDLW